MAREWWMSEEGLLNLIRQRVEAMGSQRDAARSAIAADVERVTRRKSAEQLDGEIGALQARIAKLRTERDRITGEPR